MAVEKAKGPRNRPRATLVCSNCRSRKIKCDAEKLPEGSDCTSCRNTKTKCHVLRDCDRRRHGASHQKIAEMQERIRSLESLVRQSLPGEIDPDHSPMDISPKNKRNQFSPPRSNNRNSTIDGTEDTIVVNHNPQSPLSPSYVQQRSDWQPTPPSTANGVRANQGADHNTTFSIPNLPTVPPSLRLSPLPADAAGSDHGGQGHARPEENIVHVRRDSVTNDVAFYGATTQAHLHSPESDIKNEIVPDFVDFGQETLMNLDSTQLRKSLLTNFFRVQRLSQVIVNEEFFRRDRAASSGNVRSRYYSKFLESAMLAAAARHSTSGAVRRLATQYADRAKNLIRTEIEQPTIASLQGFLLLSDLEATKGCARVGWSFSCIAAGFLIDLALHVNSSQYARRFNVSQEEANFRDSLLLGTFVYSTLWSLYLGRPSPISTPVICAVRRVVEKHPRDTTLYMWVQLCLQMLDIIEVLNENPEDRRLDANQRLRSYEISLRSSFDGLPPELSFDDARIDDLEADAYAPYMQYFGMQVILHRTMTNTGESVGSDGEDLQQTSLERLQNAIYENAVRIARLVLSFQRTFGLESMVTVMLDNVYVAAVALIHHLIRMQQQSRPVENDTHWLRSLYQILASVEKHFPITRTMRSSLIQLVEKTPLVNIFVDKTPITSPGASVHPSHGMADSTLMIHPRTMALVGNPAFQQTEQGGIINTDDVMFTTEDEVWMHDLAWNMPVFSNPMNDVGFATNFGHVPLP